MGTRSVIAVENAETKIVRAIYCLWAGYVHGGVGECLHLHYQDENKIAELIALGDLSILKENVAPADGEKHDFKNPAEKVTIAYHRDRGEELEPAQEYETAQALLDAAGDNYWAEYVYLRRDGKWYVGSPFEPKNGFVTVESVL